mmetsp:Transcript_6740/g.28261  ORF Transcript_6740/g.28261 Transcript_6740/m.28261 type:complete len:305 (+) Transcript_6740:432-1346(+)
MRRAILGLGDDALDLLELLHQVKLGRQAAGRVGDDDIDAAGTAGIDRVEGHRRRIPALLADDLDLGTVGPDAELLAGRGTEGVGSGQQHALVGPGQMAGQFADAGGLAGTVHANDHHHGGHVSAHLQAFFERRQHIGQGVHQQAAHRLRILGLGRLHAALEVVKQKLGRLHAGIGQQERFFELFVQPLIDLRAGEDLGDARAGLAQAGPQAVQPVLPRRVHRGARRPTADRRDDGRIRRRRHSRRSCRHRRRVCGSWRRRARHRARNRLGDPALGQQRGRFGRRRGLGALEETEHGLHSRPKTR